MESINEKAVKLVQELINEKEEFKIEVYEGIEGCTIIDAGVNVKGSVSAGLIITEICMGGLGKAKLTHESFGKTILPAVFVETDYPALSTLAAQYAGWRIKVGDYFAMGSGPARALSLKPKEIYERINYKDEAKHAVIVLESDKLPSNEALKYIAEKCNIELKNLYAIVTPTSSLAGSTQISGRIVETGVHKLNELGFDPKKILHGSGYAPIAPIHPNSMKAMGRTNDALYYGGVTYYIVDFDNDEELKRIVKQAPSSTAKDYGKPFYKILKDANFDFYQIDPNLFAPAKVTINNIKSGFTYTAGEVNEEVLLETMGITKS
ncbi:MAG: methenyltetrahydromethanopterin cyclohydrolase [Candidatus Bathyarchaeia archaeon]|nr:methenyltetrahydromethanopterin cyclohydrolase [Candidatus Bathyarchaeota archaeon]